jgi:hypothetical protein
MELKINIIEAAAEIAEERVTSYFAEKHSINKYTFEGQKVLDALMYTGCPENLSFTEKAQDLFCLEYDAIFEKLIDCKTQEMPVIKKILIGEFEFLDNEGNLWRDQDPYGVYMNGVIKIRLKV